MRWPIRARLTLWYLGVVVTVLVVGAVGASVAQRRLGLARLDDDLTRTMATLLGVMRTELGEGLSLQDSAAEASAEVVAPGRSLALLTPDRAVLAMWGLPMDRASVITAAGTDVVTTLDTPAGSQRVHRRVMDTGDERRYVAVVMAPLAELEDQQAEVTRAMTAGVLVALLTAGIGGWLAGRRMLTPLADMAEQATRINERDPRGRLTTPQANDELGQMAAAFNGLLDRLSAALDQQRQFMADASHELRTPVSVVHTTAQVTLARPHRTPDEYRESLGIVAEQSARLARMVDAMFLLSRAEAHGLPLRREFVNLDDIVAESVRALRVLADQRGVTIAVDGDQEVGLTGDDALLRQLVGNLLDNAIRHSRADGRVRVDLRSRSGTALLSVTNDGAPIAESDRDRIFDRFVRIGHSDGAGLGLPIVRWIAEAHGGGVVLEPGGPEHTTFTVTLPTTAGPRSDV
jgi:heavy metal sensor kinase